MFGTFAFGSVEFGGALDYIRVMSASRGTKTYLFVKRRILHTFNSATDVSTVLTAHPISTLLSKNANRTVLNRTQLTSL